MPEVEVYAFFPSDEPPLVFHRYEPGVDRWIAWGVVHSMNWEQVLRLYGPVFVRLVPEVLG